MYFGFGDGETPSLAAHQFVFLTYTTRVVGSQPAGSILYGPVPIGFAGLYVVSLAASVISGFACVGLTIGMLYIAFCHCTKFGVDLNVTTTLFPAGATRATLRYRLFHGFVLNRARLRLKATSLRGERLSRPST